MFIDRKQNYIYFKPGGLAHRKKEKAQKGPEEENKKSADNFSALLYRLDLAIPCLSTQTRTHLNT
jgi:hypothetical protein